MNRLSRAGIAVVVLASALWAGGVAEAVQVPSAATVCVNASSGVVSLMRYETMYCSTQDWSQSKPAPPLCWNDSSVVRQALRRSISIAPSTGCAAPLRSVPADEVLLLCGDVFSGVLRWPATGNCLWYNSKTWIRSAAASNVATTTPISSNTSTPTATTAVVVPKVSLTATWIQSITFPKAVTVTANVAGTIYFAEGDFVVKTVSDITSAPSYRWASGTVTSANTPTSIAIDVDALANGYYRVFIANSQGVLSEPATNFVTISVPRTPTAAEIAAGTTTTSTTAAPLTCVAGGSCTVGVDTGAGGGTVFYYSTTAFTSIGSDCGTNCHYLEAASADQSVGIAWATTAASCYNVGSTSNSNDCQVGSIYAGDSTAQAASRTAATAIGVGMANTNRAYARITTAGNALPTDYAVGIAWAYTNNSKSDWFLPSKLELNQMCRYAWNLTVDNTATTCTGTSGSIRSGVSAVKYWSSSEYTPDTFGRAWTQNFGPGFMGESPGDFGQPAKFLTMYVRPVRAG